MEYIEVKIVIPKSEYKDWDEYFKGKELGVMKSVESDLRHRIRQDGVTDFTISSTHIKD